MKKLLLLLIIPALTFGFFHLQQNNRPIEALTQIKGEGPAHPGWFALLKEKKGEIPRGVVNRILNQQDSERSGTSNLQSISFAGPENYGGRTRALAFDITNTDRMLAGGVSGGVWESMDRGQTWAPLDDLAPSLSVTYIAQDPISKVVWYYSTGEPAGNSAGIPGNGVYKSIDNGKTFTQIPGTELGALDETWVIKPSPVSFGVVFAGTESGLMRSDDGGSNWYTAFATGANAATDVELFADGSVIVAMNGAGIFKSPDGTTGSFVQMTSGLPTSNYQRIEIAVCRDFPNIMFAAYQGPGGYDSEVLDVFRSVDGGVSWATMSNPDDVANVTMRFPWYAFLIAVKPDDPNTVLVGSVDLAYTQSSGLTWSEGTDSHADYHIGVFHPDDTDELYVGNDGGVYRYNANNLNGAIDDLNAGYNVTQYYTGTFFPQGMSMMGGMQDNGTNRGLNGDTDFGRMFGGDGSYCAVDQQNPNLSYVSWQNGNVYRAYNSFDFSPNYNRILDLEDDFNDTPWFINPFEINPVDGEQIYLASRNRIYISKNAGTAWDSLTFGLSGGDPYSIAILPKQNPTLYVGGTNMLLYRIDDAYTASRGDEVRLSGHHPNEIAGGFINCVTIHPDNSDIVYVGLSNYSSASRAWRVEGMSGTMPVWTSIGDNLPEELPVNYIEVHPDHPDSFFVAGTDFGLYTTTDAGQTWTLEEEVPRVPIFEVLLRQSDLTLFAFTHGRGVWTAKLPGAPTTSIEQDLAEVATVYPNPTQDIVRVQLGDPSLAKNATIEVMGIDGKMVFMPEKLTGDHQINLENQPAGTYVIRMINESNQYVTKVIKY